MKSVAFHEFGSPSLLQVIGRPVPEPGAGEVVVRVTAASVNPTDLMMLKGQQAAMMEGLAPPFVAGMEFSGHVAAVGPGVDLAAGTPVIGVINPRRPDGGGQSQYIRVPASHVASVPEGTDLVAAATVPMNALTALLALEIAGLRPGQILLVTGGAGMLGGSVLQLARDAGLKVVTNAAPADEALVRSLGADVVLPRSDGLLAAFHAAVDGPADALIDGALIGNEVSSLVAPGGAAVSLRKSAPIADPRLRCTNVMVTDGMGRRDLMQAIVAHLANGTLRGRVAEGGVFPFAEARAAYEKAETNTSRGRVVLTFDS